MKKLWDLLNSPLIVVLIALLVWPILGAYTGYKVIETGAAKVKGAVIESLDEASNVQNEQLKEKLAAFRKIEVTNVKVVQGGWTHQEKVIGEITNNFDKTITSLHITISFYNSNGELLDVKKEWLPGSIVPPTDKYAFAVIRQLGDHNSPKESLKAKQSYSAKISVSDLNVLK
jgi:hypothetical protein